MNENYDALNDLERKMSEYEKKRPRTPWWKNVRLLTTILFVLMLVVFVLMSLGILWNISQSSQISSLQTTVVNMLTVSASPTFIATPTPVATETATSTPTLTLTATPTETQTATATYTSESTTQTPATPTNTAPAQIGLSHDLLKITAWQDLCPYPENKLYDIPPIKIELSSADWRLILRDQSLYLIPITEGANQEYLLELTANDKPVAGYWGLGMESARQLSFEQCGSRNMDQENYFWMPSFAEKAAAVNRYRFQVISGNQPISNREEVALSMSTGNKINVNKLYYLPLISPDPANIACDGNCQDLNIVSCMFKTADAFYAVRIDASRRLYWAYQDDVQGGPVCPPGIYMGSTSLENLNSP